MKPLYRKPFFRLASLWPLPLSSCAVAVAANSSAVTFGFMQWSWLEAIIERRMDGETSMKRLGPIQVMNRNPSIVRANQQIAGNKIFFRRSVAGHSDADYHRLHKRPVAPRRHVDNRASHSIGRPTNVTMFLNIDMARRLTVRGQPS
jgi:hypothetical protein